MMNLEKPHTTHRMITLAINDTAVLRSAYMSFLDSGGLFVPTSRQFKLAEQVYLLLNLMGEPEKLPILGEVVWITPQGAEGNRTAGVGVQFKAEGAKLIQNKIEAYLPEDLKLDSPTHTL